MSGGDEHPLGLTVWYPALNPDGAEESIAYHFDIQSKFPFELPDWYEPIILGHALTDAQPDDSGGPYPLVIFSHGFGVYRQTYAYLTEHLASYGFVVIAPDHLEVWNPELSEVGESAFERPLDIQQVIAFAETLAAPGGEMAGLLDINQIAVAGHSLGGYTALTAGGARFDTRRSIPLH
jgi:predicted dienelactone hydrolase